MLWLAGVLHAFTHVYHVALIPLYLLIQRDFKFESIGKATSLVTIMLVAYYLPGYALGILADRVSRKKLLAWGLAINAVGFIGLAFAPNYPCAVLAIIVAGIGGSGYHPAATAMIARLCPTYTGKALGLVGIGAGVGFFLGPLYSGWRAAALEPALGAAAWRRPVLELGIIGLVGAIFFALLADNEKPFAENKADIHPTGKMFPTTALVFIFVACSVAFCLRDFGGAGMVSLSSIFLQNTHGFDSRRAGIAVSSLFLGSVIGNPLLGGLSDRRRKRWITFVICTGATLIVMFPHLPASWTIPCFFAFGFFFLACFPMVEAALMQSVPDAVRGRVFGFFVMMTGLFGNLAHWFVGAQVRRMGDAAHVGENYFTLYNLLAGAVFLSLLGLPCLYLLRKREHLEKVS
jgi:MFS family permease